MITKRVMSRRIHPQWLCRIDVKLGSPKTMNQKHEAASMKRRMYIHPQPGIAPEQPPRG
ncbi:hypothetical protein RRSWK_04386 [Rhodopirellula sp. SWK7]|nr:hypothetical protein RRSWK_04386 [Rhodopirellula sp. SWK7]